MAKLSPTDTSPSTLIKMLLLGFSGTGKSWATTCLAVPGIVPDFPGFELRVLDADGKYLETFKEQLSIWKQSGKITEAQYKKALYENLDIIKVREATGLTSIGFGGKDTRVGIGSVGTPMAWKETCDQLAKWQNDWDDTKILIGDSLTFIAQIIGNWTQAMNNATNKAIQWNQYGVPQKRIIDFMTLCADISAHTIITGHQAPLEIRQKTGETKINERGEKEEPDELVESAMMPVALGRANRIMVPAQFNHLLVVAQTPNKDRRIFTQSEDGVVTKTPFWARAAKSYPIEDGLAQYFMLRS